MRRLLCRLGFHRLVGTNVAWNLRCAHCPFQTSESRGGW